jgi:hypothetical protein
MLSVVFSTVECKSSIWNGLAHPKQFCFLLSVGLETFYSLFSGLILHELCN